MRTLTPVPLTVAAAIGVALLAVAASSCGGSGPSTSTPPPTVPVPTPSAPPVGGGGDSFYDASCRLGPGDPEAGCDRGSERTLNVYEEALDTLVQQKPGIFDLTDEYAPGTRAYRVKDKEAYLNGIVAIARGRGLCAEREPDDAAQKTVRMKLDNDSSDEYDTLLASGHMSRGLGAYRQSCKPANFPVERTADDPPIGSGCGRPYPPEVSRFNCKVHIPGTEYYTLDSTPIVGPDPGYCAAIGFTDGRALCPIRTEGAPDRVACENWRVGRAQDSGRGGPTWRKVDGSFCTGKASGCQNHPDTQYSLWTYVPGTYVVSAANGVSCSVTH
jgi:hypothetical protein